MLKEKDLQNVQDLVTKRTDSMYDGEKPKKKPMKKRAVKSMGMKKKKPMKKRSVSSMGKKKKKLMEETDSHLSHNQKAHGRRSGGGGKGKRSSATNKAMRKGHQGTPPQKKKAMATKKQAQKQLREGHKKRGPQTKTQRASSQRASRRKSAATTKAKKQLREGHKKG